MTGLNLNITITPAEMEDNVTRRFAEFEKHLKKEIGSSLDKKDIPIFKGLFRNGYVACLKDFSQGKVPVEATVTENKENLN